MLIFVIPIISRLIFSFSLQLFPNYKSPATAEPLSGVESKVFAEQHIFSLHSFPQRLHRDEQQVKFTNFFFSLSHSFIQLFGRRLRRAVMIYVYLCEGRTGKNVAGAAAIKLLIA